MRHQRIQLLYIGNMGDQRIILRTPLARTPTSSISVPSRSRKTAGRDSEKQYDRFSYCILLAALDQTNKICYLPMSLNGMAKIFFRMYNINVTPPISRYINKPGF